MISFSGNEPAAASPPPDGPPLIGASCCGGGGIGGAVGPAVGRSSEVWYVGRSQLVCPVALWR